MTRFLVRSFVVSAITSLLGVLLFILVWPDPLEAWGGGEWRHVLRYVGVVLIFLSLLLSLRRRVFRSWGRLPTWLSFHEYASTIGFLLIFYHAFGYGFHALFPWLLMVAMCLCVGSGLLVKWLVLRASSRPKGAKPPQPKFSLKTWRVWHLRFGIVSVVLTIIHAGTAYMYGGY